MMHNGTLAHQLNISLHTLTRLVLVFTPRSPYFELASPLSFVGFSLLGTLMPYRLYFAVDAAS